ncbi:EamA family transporter [Streptomyces sp. NPDC003442]
MGQPPYEEGVGQHPHTGVPHGRGGMPPPGDLHRHLPPPPSGRPAPILSPRRAAAVAAVAGALGTLATILYLLATRRESLSVAVVLSALYPAVPVLLALTFLRERITRPQAVGLLGAGLAIGLIALN